MHDDDRLELALTVTSEHAKLFTQEIADLLNNSTVLEDLGLLAWPEGDGELGNTPAQERFFLVEAEIIRVTMEVAGPLIATIFQKAATEVLARERKADEEKDCPEKLGGRG